MNKTKFETNLSQGNVAKQLLRFSMPLLISNIIQSLYSVADMIIVGQFNGAVSMSGVNIGGQVTFLVTNLVFGLAAGATVLIGQYIGSGKRDELEDTISTLFTTLLAVAGVLTVLMFLLRGPILTLIRTPAESYTESKNYLLITALGTVFIFGYNAFSAVMRGMGDSRRPLYFVGIACGTNVILDLLFVAVFRWGAGGAATATVISQAVSMILCIFYFERNGFMFKFKLSSFRIKKERLILLLKIGGPMSIQNTVTSISFLCMTTMVNTIGVTASAAVGAVGKINMFAILPALAMSSAVSSVCAHNIGAGEYKRAVKTMQIGILIAITISIVIFSLVTLFPSAVISMFDNDPKLIEAGVAYMRTFSFDYLFVPFVFTLNGLFIGAGHTTFSLFNGMLASLLIRIPVAYIFGIVLEMGLTGVGLGAPVASFIAMLTGLIYFISGKWKRSVIIKRNDKTHAA
ncbi:MAG: MATE family efflux transporter [Eubacteriales bacterium]